MGCSMFDTGSGIREKIDNSENSDELEAFRHTVYKSQDEIARIELPVSIVVGPAEVYSLNAPR
jgi:hypothetical protein